MSPKEPGDRRRLELGVGDEEVEDVAEERDLRGALPRRAIERLEEGPVVARAPADVTVCKNGPHRPKITKIGPARGNCPGQDLFPTVY